MRELQQAVERLSQENQLLRQGQAGIAALAENLGRLATSLQRGDRKLLIDTKGIGRPEVFSNDDSHFRRWARSVVNLTTAIFGSSFQSILEWVVDQDEEITVERVEEEQPEAEVGMFELGAFTQGESPKDPSWVRFNLDTGAAQTAIPVDWKDRIPTKEGAQMMFKTASGELVPGTGTGTFQGKSETGSRCRVTGSLAPVHKPLVSAYKCLKHGRIAVLDQDGGQLIPVDSATGRKIQQLLNKPSKAQKNTWLPICQEKGVYNFYLKSEDCSGFGRQSNET